MTSLFLASFWQGLLVFLFIPLSLLLCLIVLIQKPRGGGLTGAFGGAGGGTQMFGGKSGDVLTWITVSFFAAFILLGILLVVSTRNEADALRRPVTPAVETSADPLAIPQDPAAPITLPPAPVTADPVQKSAETPAAPAASDTPPAPAPTTGETKAEESKPTDAKP